MKGKVLYATCLYNSLLKLTAERLDEANEQQKVQDEEDTHMLLHANHAAADYDSIITVADDTEVLMLSMAVQAHIDNNINTYGTRARTRNLMSRKRVQLLHKEHVLLFWECTNLHGECFLGIRPCFQNKTFQDTILGSARVSMCYVNALRYQLV